MPMIVSSVGRLILSSVAILSPKTIANFIYTSPRRARPVDRGGSRGVRTNPPFQHFIRLAIHLKYPTVCRWFTSLVAIENQHCPNKLSVASTAFVHGRPVGECEACARIKW